MCMTRVLAVLAAHNPRGIEREQYVLTVMTIRLVGVGVILSHSWGAESPLEAMLGVL